MKLVYIKLAEKETKTDELLKNKKKLLWVHGVREDGGGRRMESWNCALVWGVGWKPYDDDLLISFHYKFRVSVKFEIYIF